MLLQAVAWQAFDFTVRALTAVLSFASEQAVEVHLVDRAQAAQRCNCWNPDDCCVKSVCILLAYSLIFLFLELRLSNACTVPCAEPHTLQSKSCLVMSCLRAVKYQNAVSKQQSPGMHAAAKRTELCYRGSSVPTTFCAFMVQILVRILTMKKL